MKNFHRLFCMVMVLVLGLWGGALAIEQSDIEGVWDVDMKYLLMQQGVLPDQVNEMLEQIGGMFITITFTPDQQLITELVAGGEVTQEKYTYTLKGDMLLINDGSVCVLVREEDTLAIIEPDGFNIEMTWRHGFVVEAEDAVIDSEIVGVWEVDTNSLMAMLGMNEKEAVVMEHTMEFTTDGRVIMTLNVMGETDVEEYPYELHGNRIIMNGVPTDFFIDGNSMLLTEGEMMMFFTRVMSAEEAPAS